MYFLEIINTCYLNIILIIYVINNLFVLTGVFDQPRVTQFGRTKRPADSGVRVADLQHGRRVRQVEAVKWSDSRFLAQTQSLVSVSKSSRSIILYSVNYKT